MNRVMPSRVLPVVTEDGLEILREDLITAAREADISALKWRQENPDSMIRKRPANQHEQMINDYLNGKKIGTMVRELRLYSGYIPRSIKWIYERARANAGGSVTSPKVLTLTATPIPSRG